jgi:hypothetical protein
MEGEIERSLSREALEPEQYRGMEKLKVGIMGISAGAGAGFIAGCLARYLANTGKHEPAVIELGRSSLFDSCGMDKRFAGRSWFRFYQALADGINIRGKRNPDEGINWVLRSPEEEKIKLSFEQKLRLAAQAAGDVILCDLSGEEAIDFELIKSMDRILVLIDPMPSRMLAGYGDLCRLRSFETEAVIYAINKMNRGVNARQMADFLKLKQPILIPLVNPEFIYHAEYNCKIPYSVRDVRKCLQEPLGAISTALFR